MKSGETSLTAETSRESCEPSCREHNILPKHSGFRIFTIEMDDDTKRSSHHHGFTEVSGRIFLVTCDRL